MSFVGEDIKYGTDILQWDLGGDYSLYEGATAFAASANTGNIFDEALLNPYLEFLTVDKEDLSDPWRTGYLTLFTHPCMQVADNSSTPVTCAAMCTDAESLFSTWQTLWTCLQLASISLAAARFKGIDGEDKLNGTIKAALKAVSGPGVDLTAINGAAVLNTTYRCALASCTQNSMGRCNEDLEDLAEEFLAEDSNQWSFLNDTYCNFVESSINVDVAGPGVIISYLFQSICAIYAWVVVLLLSAESTANLLSRPYLYVLRLRRARNYTLASLLPQTTRLLHRIEDSNFMHTTAAFLTEFHEAQCFFIFATSVALIYAQKQPADFNGAENWQSLVDNQALLSILGLSGAAPLVLTQLTLHRLSMSSVYSLTCSTLALIMAGVAMTQLKEFDADRVHHMFRQAEGIEECGWSPSLRTFCATSYEDQKKSVVQIFPWLALLFVLWWIKIESMLSKGRGSYPARAKKQHLEDVFALSRRATATEWTKDIVPRFVHLCIPVAHGIIVFIVIRNLDYLRSSLGQGPSGEDEWNIGQIIAMLIWVPVLAKYLYTVLFGMERGFAIRLSNAFTIRRKTEKDHDTSEHDETVELQPTQTQPVKRRKYNLLDDADDGDGDVGRGPIQARESV